MSKHYFAGANTPAGFFSYYDNILPPGDTNRKIYIKGGSGTGKSTLMKKTAGIFEKRGFTAEYFHCSNDAKSLDGISILEAGIAVVDGTSPHPADPQLPAAIDEIFNASDFLDTAYIKENKDSLTELLTEKKALYERAYGYLSSAIEIHRLNEIVYENTLDFGALNTRILEVLRIFDGVKPNNAERGGSDRKLFATAITPDGIKSLVNSALKAEKIYVLNGAGAMGITVMLDSVQKNANLHGLNTVSLKSPLNPVNTEHLYIPGLDTAFITSNRYHEAAIETEAEKIDFKAFLNTEVSRIDSEIDYNNGIFDELLKKAIKTMAQAKSVHLKIEEVYSEAMDFKRMHRAYDKILEDMFE
ncbi:MAG: ATPase [Oscillospiraceae bacterium]|nr:ATPase [Oscillospiraceae bacterium]